MSHPALLAVAALSVVLAAAWLLATLNERRRRSTQIRLAAVLGTDVQASRGIGTPLSLRLPRAPGQARRGSLLAQLRHRLAEELEATGDRMTIARLLTVALVGALITAVLLLGVFQWPAVIALPLVLAAGAGATTYWLRAAQRRFQRRFVDLFPDALDVVVRAVRAGLPVLDAIEAAGSNVAEPVAGEFRRLIDEMRIGIDLEGTLDHAANRIRVNDFRFFAATLALQRRTGGSLAETLANLAGLIRRRKEVRLKARSLSAESRATAYVIGVLPFVMVGVMYLINPKVVSLLFTDHRGKIILGAAIFLLAMGFAVMRGMLKRAMQ